jgi:hypothetical protein
MKTPEYRLIVKETKLFRISEILPQGSGVPKSKKALDASFIFAEEGREKRKRLEERVRGQMNIRIPQI